ncbi:hypothetical protein PsYK624_098090 [Phanerochaete sordida]|uniref:Uncharacterized protein n=1 Tax=Phanerochaete sordida TaxID=48140 RepID=A0A9P3GHD9_9APHY|nr:hypothetical protein PsYK624_098090 [Phanerochaete sordida]
MSSTAAAVYASELVKLRYGLPLWRPEPTKFGEVEIGDVGFVLDGALYRLFNAMRPATDPLNSRGVPEGFIQFLVDEKEFLHVDDSYLPPGPVCTSSTKFSNVQAGLQASTGVAGAGVSYSFSCNATRGAIAVLGDSGRQERYIHSQDLRAYVQTYHRTWLDFARTKRYDVDKFDMVFVYGWVKTSKWALATYTSQDTDHQLSFAATANGALVQRVTQGAIPTGHAEINAYF